MKRNATGDEQKRQAGGGRSEPNHPPALPFLAATPDITPITYLITTWTHIAQALVASIGALAFIFAFICRS